MQQLQYNSKTQIASRKRGEHLRELHGATDGQGLRVLRITNRWLREAVGANQNCG